MEPGKNIPISLRIVAYLFIFIGILPFIIAGISLIRSGSLQLRASLFDIFYIIISIVIGFGILKLKSGARTCGIIILIINLIRYGIFALLLGGSSLIASLAKPDYGKGSLILANSFTIIFVSIMLAMLIILMRPNIGQLFKKKVL